MNALLALPGHVERIAARIEENLAAIFLLALRIYLAMVFFASGLTKISNLESTVALFENEYRVPLLSPMLAAYSGTAAELILPVLLVAGVITRPAAAALFVLNLVALYSYPDISPAGMKDHWVWGTMIATLVVFGAGRWSLDRLALRRLAPG